jgi:hypothetical protein
VNAIELVEHYRQIRKRLNGMPKPVGVKVPPRPVPKVEENQIVVEPPPFKGDVLKFVGVKTKHNDMRAVMRQIALDAGYTLDEVFSRTRYRKYVVVRQRIWAWLRLCGMSNFQISMMCKPDDPYDHTTIMHGIKKFNQNPVSLPPVIAYGTLQAVHGPKPTESCPLIIERQTDETSDYPHTGGHDMCHHSNQSI